MSTGKQSQPSAPTPETKTSEKLDLVQAAINASPPAKRDRMTDMLKALGDYLGEYAMRTTPVWEGSVAKTLNACEQQIDALLTKQLAAIMHHPKFQKLEGSWRGLNYLVMNSETSPDLKIHVMNVSKDDLYRDLTQAIEFDQSKTFKNLYEKEFGSPGGSPYAAVIGDYEFTNHPQDIELLTKMSGVAAAGFCPFLSAADPQLLDLESYTELSEPRDLSVVFDAPEYVTWKSFRESPDSQFVVLTLPRVLARLPFGVNTKSADGFNFQEAPLSEGKDQPLPHDHYTWMNPAYVLGARLTDAYAKTGWCTAIRGAENGGLVEGLPMHIFTSDDGDSDLKCPTEIAITFRRLGELDELGFLPLGWNKNSDRAVFYGAQSVHKPAQFGKNTAATENAAISARLPYIMATSRIAHFLKCIAVDKIGSFMEASDCQTWLENWIAEYILADPNSTAENKAKYPLAEARIEVNKVPGRPGAYEAICHLRPWLQMEELTASLRLVAELPARK